VHRFLDALIFALRRYDSDARDIVGLKLPVGSLAGRFLVSPQRTKVFMIALGESILVELAGEPGSRAT
jgi:hypothetical protein